MFKHTLALYAAPAVLCAVALVQRFMVHAYHLTAWKGGGFGMFSAPETSRGVTVAFLPRDGQPMRILSRELLQRVPFPGAMQLRIARISHMPANSSLRNLAHALAQYDWVAVVEPVSAAGPNGQDRVGFAEFPMPRQYVPAQAQTRDLDLRAVNIEVWEYKVEFHPPQLRLTPLASETAPVEQLLR